MFPLAKYMYIYICNTTSAGSRGDELNTRGFWSAVFNICLNAAREQKFMTEKALLSKLFK